MEEYRDIVMEIRDNSRVKSFTVLKSRIVPTSQILDKIDFRGLYGINIYRNRSAPKSTRWKINRFQAEVIFDLLWDKNAPKSTIN